MPQADRLAVGVLQVDAEELEVHERFEQAAEVVQQIGELDVRRQDASDIGEGAITGIDHIEGWGLRRSHLPDLYQESPPSASQLALCQPGSADWLAHGCHSDVAWNL